MATDFQVELQVNIYELKFWGGLRSICSLDKPDNVFSSKCIFSYSEHDEFENEIKWILHLFGASSVNIKFIKCNLCTIEKLLKKQEFVWDFVWVYVFHLFIGKHSLMLACFLAILIRPDNSMESWHNSPIVFVLFFSV